MKKSFLLVLALVASVASAHQISPLKKAKSAALESFRKVAASYGKDRDGFASTAYKIREISPVKKGEKAEATIERVVKFSLHRDYPITGDDGGYGFSKLPKEVTDRELERAISDMSWLFDSDNEAEGTKLLKSFKKANHAGLLTLTGTGAGNNTHAEILVVADVENQEFVTMIASNFGSDN